MEEEEEDEEDDEEDEDDEEEDEEVRRRVFYACHCLLRIRAYRKSLRRLIPETSNHVAHEAYASTIRPRKPSPKLGYRTMKTMIKWTFSLSVLLFAIDKCTSTCATVFVLPSRRFSSVIYCPLALRCTTPHHVIPKDVPFSFMVLFITGLASLPRELMNQAA